MSTLRPEAAHRGHHTQEGWRGMGYVGLFGLGLRGEGGSAVPTKRESEPQAMWGGEGEV